MDMAKLPSVWFKAKLISETYHQRHAKDIHLIKCPRKIPGGKKQQQSPQNFQPWLSLKENWKSMYIPFYIF